MTRTTRYQGAIVRDQHILLIKHTEHATGRSYWVIPGGGIEPDESEHACVQREMQEETNLHVHVQGLLLDEPGHSGGVYMRRKTYLCTVVSGDAQPGYEPEPDAAANYAITEVGWFSLADAGGWSTELCADPITYPQLQRIQAALGFS